MKGNSYRSRKPACCPHHHVVAALLPQRRSFAHLVPRLLIWCHSNPVGLHEGAVTSYFCSELLNWNPELN
jgi:hypothetical protein